MALVPALIADLVEPFPIGFFLETLPETRLEGVGLMHPPDLKQTPNGLTKGVYKVKRAARFTGWPASNFVRYPISDT